jgi:rSAM/selenodomain-associated transferase 1
VVYPILDPRYSDTSLHLLTALAVMAKAPHPGRVKTRLSPPLTQDEAAAINTCFLQDTTVNIADVAEYAPCAGVISYTPVGDEHLFEGLLPEGYCLLPQRGDGFGERLFSTAEDLFRCGFSSVCLIDSDSPTVPREAFAMAVSTLQRPGDRIVLGPSHDGGYYLIGMKRTHSAPFENITWSTAAVFSETVAAVDKIGVELITLPLWYDVDDGGSLAVLRNELCHGLKPDFAALPGFVAEHTRRFLQQLDGPA